MDATRNPFAPGAGTPPPELSGRSAVLNGARTALARTLARRPAPSTILVGLRGVGKTVLLVRMQQIATELRMATELVEAREDVPIARLLAPGLRRILAELSRVEAARALASRAMSALAGFVKTFKVQLGDVTLSVDPEFGLADSGDLETDLSTLFVAVAEAGAASGTGVALLIDEMQYLPEADFAALIMALHRVSQSALPLLVLGAGLPQVVGQAGRAKSYAERLFQFPPIGPLSQADAREAILRPVGAANVDMTEDAVEAILRDTEGYAYFLQQWGYETWNAAASSPITRRDVDTGRASAIETLDQSFFRVRLDRCTPAERRYMRAMAELGPGPHRSGAIADALGAKVTSLAPIRAGLIKKGMIYAPQHGDTAFTVPMFDSFMRRALPNVSSTD